jgi:hypothetical protein
MNRTCARGSETSVRKGVCRGKSPLARLRARECASALDAHRGASHHSAHAASPHRNRHLPVHRHRGLDQPAARARRRLPEGSGSSPSIAAAGVLRSRWRRGGHSRRRVSRRFRASERCCTRRRRRSASARRRSHPRAYGSPYRGADPNRRGLRGDGPTLGGSDRRGRSRRPGARLADRARARGGRTA